MKNIQFHQNSLQAIQVQDSFYSKHREMRSFYEQQFKNPLHAHSKRFCWDYWNVPDQYRLLRTPAQNFFGEKLFKPFLEHLLNWGRMNLGCQMISHPWLSAYVNDCYQDIHSDVPHGPWSFVYSLSPWKNRSFSGGETFVAQPKLLNYFQDFSSSRSDESKQLLIKIPAEQNRLTVFDPRYPHGVTRVNGVEDLLDARLVIHGWFTEPRPMVEGSLTPKKAIPSMDKIAEYLLHEFSKSDLSGIFCIRLKISASGKLTAIQVLTSHLIHTQTGKCVNQKWVMQLLDPCSEIQFPKSSGTTLITLPIEIKK
jgi:hypothetical protein